MSLLHTDFNTFLLLAGVVVFIGLLALAFVWYHSHTKKPKIIGLDCGYGIMKNEDL